MGARESVQQQQRHQPVDDGFSGACASEADRAQLQKLLAEDSAPQVSSYLAKIGLKMEAGDKAALKALGYPVDTSTDTYLAWESKWVKQFQIDHGLSPDTIIGPLTRAKLDQIKEEWARPLDPKSIDIRKSQRIINTFTEKPIRPDGFDGPLTRAAATTVLGHHVERISGEVQRELAALYNDRLAKQAAEREAREKLNAPKKIVDPTVARDAREISKLVDRLQNPESAPKLPLDRRNKVKEENNSRFNRIAGMVISHSKEPNALAELNREYKANNNGVSLAEDIKHRMRWSHSHDLPKLHRLHGVLTNNQTEIDYAEYRSLEHGWTSGRDQRRMLEILNTTTNPARFAAFYTEDEGAGEFFKTAMKELDRKVIDPTKGTLTFQQEGRRILTERFSAVEDVKVALERDLRGYVFMPEVEKAHELLRRDELRKQDLRELEELARGLIQSGRGPEFDRQFALISGGKNFIQLAGERAPVKLAYDQGVLEGYYAKAIGVHQADEYIELAEGARAVSGGFLPSVGAGPPRSNIFKRFFNRDR